MYLYQEPRIQLWTQVLLFLPVSLLYFSLFLSSFLFLFPLSIHPNIAMQTHMQMKVSKKEHVCM